MGFAPLRATRISSVSIRILVRRFPKFRSFSGAALVVVESADDLGTGSAQPRSDLRAAAWSKWARKVVEEP